ncbi:MAG TPA: OB-fold nucleic acid binding domain-containing protein [archaeon]|nr:OB-fold nucleic acid binding domain-containing protein [archaeon]HLD81332.1 OB-fold nucleic acid binding domain-containing protein [archaeon]
MKEDELAVLSLSLSLICILLLYFFTQSIQPAEYTAGFLATAPRELEGKKVKVTGVLTDLKASDAHLFFSIVDATDSIKGVAFNPPFEARRAILSGESVVFSFKGVFKVYRGTPEVIIESVELPPPKTAEGKG